MILASQPHNLLMNQCEKSLGQVQACRAGGALLRADIEQEFGSFTGWFVAYIVAAKHAQDLRPDTWKHHLCYFMLPTVASQKPQQALDEQQKSLE